MKLDIISVVILVFCLGVFASVFSEVTGFFSSTKAEVVVAESR